MEGPLTEKGNITASPGNSDQEVHFGHTEFDMAQQEDTCVALMEPRVCKLLGAKPTLEMCIIVAAANIIN